MENPFSPGTWGKEVPMVRCKNRLNERKKSLRHEEKIAKENEKERRSAGALCQFLVKKRGVLISEYRLALRRGGILLKEWKFSQHREVKDWKFSPLEYEILPKYPAKKSIGGLRGLGKPATNVPRGKEEGFTLIQPFTPKTCLQDKVEEIQLTKKGILS